MEIRLNKLTLENFKGFRACYDFEPNGQNVTVRGDNATGKTTLADAFRWLLFGKDTHDRTDFQLKTVDNTGKEIHNLDHTVEAELYIED